MSKKSQKTVHKAQKDTPSYWMDPFYSFIISALSKTSGLGDAFT